MKSLQLYVCEHCGTQYKEKGECLQCEKSHVLVANIHDVRFNNCKGEKNYPYKVEIEMSDGKRIWFKR